MDGNYVIQGNHLLKIDDQQNTLWSEDIEGSTIGKGDRNLQQLSDGGFVYTSGDFRNIWIVKTDENGVVNSAEENSIPLFDDNLTNYPNPFNPQTTIFYELPPDISDPMIEIFNIKGQRIRELKIDPPSHNYGVTRNLKLKMNSVVWNAEGNASGVYFYRLKGDGFSSNVRKMIMLK